MLGAGILGCSLAYHLARSNVSCVVIEKEPLPAMHASGKNAGMFRQLYRHPVLTEWAQESIATLPIELKQACFQETGSYVVGRCAPGHNSKLFKNIDRRRVCDGRVESLSAVYTATDGLLDSPNLVQGIKVLAQRAGAEFRFNCKVSKIDGQSILEEDDREIARASKIVNAAGAWAANLFGSNVALQPYARHLFVVDGWPPEFMPEPQCGFYWDEVSGWYMRRWAETERLVSVCDKQPVVTDTPPLSSVPTDLVAHLLIERFPEIGRKLSIKRHWSCLRTYTPDQLPVVGRDPISTDRYWLAGFGGFGMSTGFAAAKNLADAIAAAEQTGYSDFYPHRVVNIPHKFPSFV